MIPNLPTPSAFHLLALSLLLGLAAFYTTALIRALPPFKALTFKGVKPFACNVCMSAWSSLLVALPWWAAFIEEWGMGATGVGWLKTLDAMVSPAWWAEAGKMAAVTAAAAGVAYLGLERRPAGKGAGMPGMLEALGAATTVPEPGTAVSTETETLAELIPQINEALAKKREGKAGKTAEIEQKGEDNGK